MAAEDSKARIRAVAVELFTAHGYEQTSLREIADRVGMTKASLYYHYPSKQALLLALVEPLVTEWRQTVERIEAQPHNPETVRTVLADFLDIVLRHRPACAIFMRDASAVVTSLEPIWQEMIQLGLRLNSWIAGPQPSEADRIRAIAAVEVLGAALSSVVALPDVSQPVLRQTLLDAAAAVLGLPAATTRPVATAER